MSESFFSIRIQLNSVRERKWTQYSISIIPCLKIHRLEMAEILTSICRHFGAFGEVGAKHLTRCQAETSRDYNLRVFSIAFGENYGPKLTKWPKKHGTAKFRPWRTVQFSNTYLRLHHITYRTLVYVVFALIIHSIVKKIWPLTYIWILAFRFVLCIHFNNIVFCKYYSLLI